MRHPVSTPRAWSELEGGVVKLGVIGFAVGLFADITSSIGLAFLQRYPSPTKAARLTEAQMLRFCRAQHYSGRRSPAQLLARLRGAAHGSAGKLTNEPMAQVVRSMVAVLKPLVAQT